ncbi:MAG: ParB N-terminal domain-containing protein [Patescibacteria group bacterium]|nr:ParB N-terminal domain-containing protein [Patescibacteria group bacterium]
MNKKGANYMEHNRLEMTYWPIEKLLKYENNCKTHPDIQIEKIANSIKNFSFDQPIAVDKDGIIIKGHGRLMAAQLLGLKEVPVIVRSDLTHAEAATSRIADNAVAESPWDENLLPTELHMLAAEGIDIHKDIGFSSEEIEDIFKKANANFKEGTESEQGKLDEKKLVTCPSCGYEF